MNVLREFALLGCFMKIILGVLSAIFYIIFAILAFFVIKTANTAAEYSVQVNQFNTIEEKIDTELKVLLDAISFGIYEGGEEKVDSIETVITQMNFYRQRVSLISYILLAMSLTLVIFSFFSFRQYIFQHLLVLSFIALVVGLLTPVLSFVAYQDLPILGQVVFQYDSKGILGTIIKLIESKTFFVATMLFLFSVVVPFIKLALSFFIILDKNKPRVNKIATFIHGIGKWSMLDVFVVAVFLALFALEQDGLTEARAGIGLYYFASYVLFSMLASQVFDRFYLNEK